MRPLAPVLLSFLAGIESSYRLGFSYKAVIILFVVSSAPVIFSYIRNLKFSPLYFTPLFFSLGALFILPYVNPELPSDHITHFIEEINAAEPRRGRLGETVEGLVVSAPEFSGDRVKLHIEAQRIFSDGAWRETSGGVLLTVPPESLDFKTGDRLRFLARLREPFNYGNPGEFDYKAHLRFKGIHATGFLKSERLIVKLEEGGHGAGAFIAGLRGGIRRAIDGAGTRNGESLKALIIAEKGGISPDVKEAFVKTGTAHILAISGLHVGIVALFSYNFFSFLLRRSERVMLAIDVRKTAMALSLAPVFMYGILAGFPVSTQRAVIMAFAFVCTYLINRGKDFFNTLALAALIVLAVSPAAVWDVSFQLTFAAVFSIVYFVPRFNEFLEKKDGTKILEKEGLARRFLREKLKPALLVTLAAGLGTSPILAYQFHQVSVLGIAANLIVVPITGITVPLLLIASAILPLWRGAAIFVIRLSDISFEAMITVIRFFAALPYSSLWAGSPGILELLLAYTLIVCVSNVKRDRLYRYAIPFAVIAIALDWGYWGYFARRDGLLKATFISVGQGESELVEFPDASTLLIDGGGLFGTDFDTGEKIIAPFLWSKGIRKIDYVALSHAQRDHMGGLRFIAENFDVKEFWWNGDGGLGRLGDALSRRNIKIRVLDGSMDKFSIGGVLIEPLHPLKGLELDQNNMCLVLRLTYGDKSLLFTGDIAEAAEAELVKRDVRATVLKSPHHGSRYSSSVEFLDRVAPSVIIVSAGRGNSFGFPHAETMERYARRGAKIYRTDTDGAVTVNTDGKGLKVSAYLTEGAR